MHRSTNLILIFPLCVLLAMRTQAAPGAGSGARERTSVHVITLTRLEVNDKTLELGYQIKNPSQHDIWVLVAAGNSGVDADVFIDEDGETLMIRNRLDVTAWPSVPPSRGRYVRLLAGGTQTESLSLTIPVRPQPEFSSVQLKEGVQHASRLAIEIGYYNGNLPRIIRGILEKAEEVGDDGTGSNLWIVNRSFGGLLGFNELSEDLRQRDEEVSVPYAGGALIGEQALRATADGLRIPYEEKELDSSRRYPPDLSGCTRVEIQFQPSMLEYFFPFVGQQSLLSREETEYLKSPATIIVDDPEGLKALTHDVNRGIQATGTVRQRSMAQVVCCRDGKQVMSFPIYNDESIVTGGEYRFMYFEGFPSLRMLRPQIQQCEVRVQCAANLRNLWNRLRLYHEAEKARPVRSSLRELWNRLPFFHKAGKEYPASSKWCDAMVRAYQTTGMRDERIKKPLRCPSAREGKCHYAMNPNCKLDSPPDAVLLFETKAGWNQHGGPELFTFDNHDPKGGCVVLNDGTVKFIRTKEELQQLRWK